MDLTVLNLAVPRLSADLKPSSSQLLWIVDIYGFLIAGSLITMGTLGDRIGRRRLLLIGAAAFGAASVLAAYGLSAELLGTAREAFTQAFQLTAALCAAVVLITALLATVLLRRVRVGSPLEQQAESLS
jgi:MFS family permease